MRRGAYVLVALICLAGFVAGCGGPAGTTGRLATRRLPSPDAQVRQAFARLFDTGTGAFTETMTARTAGGTLIRTTRGEFDLENSRASMTVDFSASSPEVVPAVLGQPVALSSLSQRLVRDDAVMYLAKPSWTGAQRDRWMRYQGQWLGGLGRQWSDTLTPPWDSDFDMTDATPVPLLTLPPKMVDAGSFLPSGPVVSRYLINVPVSDALMVVGASTVVEPGGGAGSGGAGPGGGGPGGGGTAGGTGPGEDLPVRVEVGSGGMIARVSLDATRLVEQAVGTRSAAPAPAAPAPAAPAPVTPAPAAPARPGGVQYSYEVRLHDLGQPVDIEIPPASAQASGGLWVQDMPAGACLTDDTTGGNAVRHLFFTSVACAQPHRYEVYARVVLGGELEPYPGRRALEQLTGQKCAEEFTRFVGVPPGESAVRFWSAPPAESAWLQGGHAAPCLLDSGAPVTGTLRGSGR